VKIDFDRLFPFHRIAPTFPHAGALLAFQDLGIPIIFLSVEIAATK
jgi:hypothetical protein